MNVIHLIGRLGQDPEATYLADGKVKVTASIAVSRIYNKDGEPDCDWFSLELWNKTAENFLRFLKKGHQVAVTGRCEIQKWTPKTGGEEKTKVVVKVSDFTLLEKKELSPAEQYVKQQQQQQYQQQPPQQQQYQQQPQHQTGYAQQPQLPPPPPYQQPQYYDQSQPQFNQQTGQVQYTTQTQQIPY